MLNLLEKQSNEYRKNLKVEFEKRLNKKRGMIEKLKNQIRYYKLKIIDYEQSEEKLQWEKREKELNELVKKNNSAIEALVAENKLK